MDTSSEPLIPSRKSSTRIGSRGEQDDTAFISALESEVGVSVDPGESAAEAYQTGRDCTIIVDSEEVSNDSPTASAEKKGGSSCTTKSATDSTSHSVENDSISSSATAYSEMSRRSCRINHSVPVYFFYSVSLVFSVGAIAVGAQFTKLCPVAPELPLMLFMVGVAATLCILFKVTDSCHESLYASTERHLFYNVACFVGYFTVTLILLAEISLVMQTDPSKDPLSPKFCHPTLYDFAYWTNWIGLILTLIAAFIHGPGLMCPASSARTSAQ